MKRRPAAICAGCLLLFLAPIRIPAAGNISWTSAQLPDNVFWGERTFLDSVLHYALSDSVRYSISINGGFFDIYHATLTDSNGNAVSQSIMESPDLQGLAVIKRPGWGIVPAWDMRSVSGYWFDSSEGYRVNGLSGANRIGCSGWMDFPNNLHIGGIANWSLRHYGNEMIVKRENAWYDDSRLGYGIFGIISLRNAVISVYGGTGPVNSSFVKVLKFSNGGHNEFPLVVSMKSAGISYQGKYHEYELSGSLVLFDIESDTGSSDVVKGLKTDFKLPGLSASFESRMPDSKYSPYVKLGGGLTRSEKVSGYDGDEEYTGLSVKYPWFLRGAAGCMVPYSIQAGLYAETARIDSGSGYINMFPFTEWTLLDPKYEKIIYTDFRHLEYGIHASRSFPFGTYHSPFLAIDISNLRLRSSFLCKELETMNLIPIGYGPLRSIRLLDENFLLFRINFGYALSYNSITFGPSVTQYLPVDLNAGSHGSTGSARNGPLRRTQHGGTLYKCTLSCRF